MIKKLRDNIYIGDKDAYKSLEELTELGVTSVVIVADELKVKDNAANQEPRVFKMGLRGDRINPPHIKDLICHTAKYMAQNGDVVLIQSVTGLQRAAFVACRVICELEARTIYEIMQEVKQEVPEFDIGKSYF